MKTSKFINKSILVTLCIFVFAAGTWKYLSSRSFDVDKLVNDAKLWPLIVLPFVIICAAICSKVIGPCSKKPGFSSKDDRHAKLLSFVNFRFLLAQILFLIVLIAVFVGSFE